MSVSDKFGSHPRIALNCQVVTMQCYPRYLIMKKQTFAKLPYLKDRDS